MHQIITTLFFRNTAIAASLLILLVLGACGQPTEQASAPPAAEPVPEPEPVTVVLYEGARLIVGDGSTPIENSAFAVDGSQFVAVGAAGEVSVPAGATRVDLTGRTVMPVLVDAHVHMGTTREALVDDLQRRAYFGVGAAVSMGSDGPDAQLAMRDEIIPGAARYRSAGQGITSPEPGRRVVHWVTSEEEARQAVREEAARNVDMIKIWVDDRDGQYDQLSPEIYSAVIDEAHQHDLRVSAHLFELVDGKGLVRAGVDIFAHGVRDQDIDDEFVQLVKERPDLVLIPNLPGRGVATDLSWLNGVMPDEELEAIMQRNIDRPEIQEAFGIQARNLVRLNEEGMTIAHGSDGNSPWMPHVEMEDMVAAGMTPAQVIVAATRNSAALLELTDMGTIETGKSADFIVLEANPLDDITNTRRIASVYLRGEEVDRAGIRARWRGE